MGCASPYHPLAPLLTPTLCTPHHPLLQASQALRDRCHAFLLSQLPHEMHAAAEAAAGRGVVAAGDADADADADAGMDVDGGEAASGRWGIAPFYVQRLPAAAAGQGGARFSFRAPTTGRNALRVLRALQVSAGWW